MRIFNTILFTFFFMSLSVAQVSSVTPFSSQGVGDVSFYGDAYFMGMGGVTAPLIDSSQTNLHNPSSYSFLGQGLPLFSLGIAHQESTFSQNEVTAQDRFTSITHMALTIPFGNRFGMAFGLKPFSRAGYEINNSQVLPSNDSIFYDYTGKGEIQEFLFGFSWILVKRLNHKLGIGANAKRYFGRIETTRRAYFINNFSESGALENGFLRAKDFGFDLGATYRFSPNSKHVLTLGGSYQLGGDIQMERTRTALYFGEFGNTNSYDTVVPSVKYNGNVQLPEQLKVGFAYEYKASKDTSSRRRGRLPSLLITGEYTTAPWSNYNESFDNFVSPTFNFFDSYSYRAGLQYTPHRDPGGRTAYIKAFQKWSYRLGAFAVATPNRSDNQQVMNYGTSFGIGIPVVLNRAVSTINISGTYGEQGTRAGSGSLSERYFGFNFGVNIAPSYDKWFKKQELY